VRGLVQPKSSGALENTKSSPSRQKMRTNRSGLMRNRSMPLGSATLNEARKKIFPKRAEGTYRRFNWLGDAVHPASITSTPGLRWESRSVCACTRRCYFDFANRRVLFSLHRNLAARSSLVWPVLLVMARGFRVVPDHIGGRSAPGACYKPCPAKPCGVDLFLVVEPLPSRGERNHSA